MCFIKKVLRYKLILLYCFPFFFINCQRKDNQCEYKSYVSIASENVLQLKAEGIYRFNVCSSSAAISMDAICNKFGVPIKEILATSNKKLFEVDFYYHGEIFTGIIKECRNGLIYSLFNVNEGKLDGEFISYEYIFELDKEISYISSRSFYNEGKITGLSYCYNENGQLIKMSEYKNGVLIKGATF